MTLGQIWVDEWYQNKSESLPQFLNKKIEELENKYQKLILQAWDRGYEECEKHNEIFGGLK